MGNKSAAFGGTLRWEPLLNPAICANKIPDERMSKRTTATMAYGCKRNRTMRCLEVSTCGWVSAGVDGPIVIVSVSVVSFVSSAAETADFFKVTSVNGSGVGSVGGIMGRSVVGCGTVGSVGLFDIFVI